MKNKFHKKLDICIVALSLVSLLYFLYLSLVYGFLSISFSWTFLVLGICFLSFACYELYKKKHVLHALPHYVQRIFLTLLTFGLLFFISVEGYIIYQGQQNSPPPQSTAIVLGAQLNGKSISRLLRYRLDKAVTFAQEYPTSNIIVSGGKGPGEDISEASAMKTYLIEHGVAHERIMIEDQSRNTLENLKFSNLKLSQLSKDDQHNDITIITNSFHMARAKLIANRCIPTSTSFSYNAKTDWDLAPVFYFREFFGFCKDWLLT